MNQLFKDKKDFNEDISTWDVSKVTNMGYMFHSASSFNQPLENWDVSKVTNMKSMFAETTSFNQPIGDWNVGENVNMDYMFIGATAILAFFRDWAPHIDISTPNRLLFPLLSSLYHRHSFLRFLNQANIVRVDAERVGYAERVCSDRTMNAALLAGEREYVRSVLEYL